MAESTLTISNGCFWTHSMANAVLPLAVGPMRQVMGGWFIMSSKSCSEKAENTRSAILFFSLKFGFAGTNQIFNINDTPLPSFQAFQAHREIFFEKLCLKRKYFVF